MNRKTLEQNAAKVNHEKATYDQEPLISDEPCSTYDWDPTSNQSGWASPSGFITYNQSLEDVLPTSPSCGRGQSANHAFSLFGKLDCDIPESSILPGRNMTSCLSSRSKADKETPLSYQTLASSQEIGASSFELSPLEFPFLTNCVTNQSSEKLAFAPLKYKRGTKYNNISPLNPVLRETQRCNQIVPSSEELFTWKLERLFQLSEPHQINVELKANFHTKNKLYSFLNFWILTALFALGSTKGKLYNESTKKESYRAQGLIFSHFQNVFSNPLAPQLKEYLEKVQKKLFTENQNRAIKKIAIALAEDLNYGLQVCNWLEENLFSESFESENIFYYWIQGNKMSPKNKAGLKRNKHKLRNEVAEIRRYLAECAGWLNSVQGYGWRTELLMYLRSETDTYDELSDFMGKKEAIFKKIFSKVMNEKLEEAMNKKIKVD